MKSHRKADLDRPSSSSRFSRSLLVTSLNSDISDYELLKSFNRCGKIIDYTSEIKELGYVVITYDDLRDAEFARHLFNGYVINNTPINIQYILSIYEDYSINTLHLQANLLITTDCKASSSFTKKITKECIDFFQKFGDIYGCWADANTFSFYLEYYSFNSSFQAFISIPQENISGLSFKCSYINYSPNQICLLREPFTEHYVRYVKTQEVFDFTEPFVFHNQKSLIESDLQQLENKDTNLKDQNSDDNNDKIQSVINQINAQIIKTGTTKKKLHPKVPVSTLTKPVNDSHKEKLKDPKTFFMFEDKQPRPPKENNFAGVTDKKTSQKKINKKQPLSPLIIPKENFLNASLKEESSSSEQISEQPKPIPNYQYELDNLDLDRDYNFNEIQPEIPTNSIDKIANNSKLPKPPKSTLLEQKKHTNSSLCRDRKPTLTNLKQENILPLTQIGIFLTTKKPTYNPISFNEMFG
ncbi:RRM domain-containing protein [Entamoeba marina]